MKPSFDEEIAKYSLIRVQAEDEFQVALASQGKIMELCMPDKYEQ